MHDSKLHFEITTSEPVIDLDKLVEIHNTYFLSAFWPKIPSSIVENFFKNCPISDDILKYMQPRGCNVEKYMIIACFEFDDLVHFNSRSGSTRYVYLNEYRKLIGATFIESSILECYVIWKIREKEWPNVSFIPSNTNIWILGNKRDEPISNDFFIYKIHYDFKDLVFIPYFYFQHCCVLILNCYTREIYHYDPMIAASSAVVPNIFLKYLQKCSVKSRLTEIKWKINSEPHEQPIQTDGRNCVIYVLKYMDFVVKRFQSSEEIEDEVCPDNERIHLAKFIVENSWSDEGVCIGCEKRNLNMHFTCKICSKEAHERCAHSFFNEEVCKLCLYTTPVEDETYKVIGLPNPPSRNRCWMNSSLQVIYSLPIFNYSCIRLLPHSDILKYFLKLRVYLQEVDPIDVEQTSLIME